MKAQAAPVLQDFSIKVDNFLVAAIVYFFLNAAGLPFGLTYMTLLSPFLYYWTVKNRKQEILWPFLCFILPYVLIHTIWLDAERKPYFTSLINLTCIYIFCQAVYVFLSKCQHLDKIFNSILKINLALCILAVPFYFTEYYQIFWIEQELTKGVNGFRRLKLFTYEASYYASLFVPIFFYFFLGWLLKIKKMNLVWLLLALGLPLMLSFSLGVIAVLCFSLILLFFIYSIQLVRKRRILYLLFWTITIVLPLIFILTYLFPDNTLFYRIENVFSGRDTSGKGRTFEAFTLAFMMLEQKSALFGIGLGQIKVLGTEIIRDFYLYPMDHEVFAIPNASAETLAIFGWMGLIIRLLLEVFFFVYTRVWTNYFRMALFLYIFIYQFTGSFITNHAEYVMWVLAFSKIFPQFNVKPARP